jgi:hypothetical protein
MRVTCNDTAIDDPTSTHAKAPLQVDCTCRAERTCAHTLRSWLPACWPPPQCSHTAGAGTSPVLGLCMTMRMSEVKHVRRDQRARHELHTVTRHTVDQDHAPRTTGVPCEILPTSSSACSSFLMRPASALVPGLRMAAAVLPHTHVARPRAMV